MKVKNNQEWRNRKTKEKRKRKNHKGNNIVPKK